MGKTMRQRLGDLVAGGRDGQWMGSDQRGSLVKGDRGWRSSQSMARILCSKMGCGSVDGAGSNKEARALGLSMVEEWLAAIETVPEWKVSCR